MPCNCKTTKSVFSGLAQCQAWFGVGHCDTVTSSLGHCRVAIDQVLMLSITNLVCAPGGGVCSWCVQEVVGDERTALQAVVAADVELMELREEEEDLNKQLQETNLESQPKGFDADEASERLNEVGHP